MFTTEAWINILNNEMETEIEKRKTVVSYVANFHYLTSHWLTLLWLNEKKTICYCLVFVIIIIIICIMWRPIQPITSNLEKKNREFRCHLFCNLFCKWIQPKHFLIKPIYVQCTNISAIRRERCVADRMKECTHKWQLLLYPRSACGSNQRDIIIISTFFHNS